MKRTTPKVVEHLCARTRSHQFPGVLLSPSGRTSALSKRSERSVDLYHAREHLMGLSKLVYGVGSNKAKQWSAARLRQLVRGLSKQS